MKNEKGCGYSTCSACGGMIFRWDETCIMKEATEMVESSDKLLKKLRSRSYEISDDEEESSEDA